MSEPDDDHSLPKGPTPRVSVIINAFNGAAYLESAVESVLQQTFRNWELILWDDGSTDSTAALFKKYTDPRLHYFLSACRSNLTAARLQAIKQCRGEWLAFLDQDDLWAPEKLEKQLDRLMQPSRREVGLVYCRTMSFGPHVPLREFNPKNEFRLLPEGDIFAHLFKDSCFISISSVIIKRSAYETTGPPPPSCRATWDYWIFTALARRFDILAVQDVQTWYRLHSRSMTCSHGIQIHAEALDLLEFWRDRVPPQVYRMRRRSHQNQIAALEMKNTKTLLSGIRRVFLHGSLMRFLGQPLARAARMVQHAIWRNKLARIGWNKPPPVP